MDKPKPGSTDFFTQGFLGFGTGDDVSNTAEAISLMYNSL
jgi:hypothetical protein